nr:hypothetical protein [Microbacterium lemovicicum]
MSGPEGPSATPVHPAVALALGAAGYVALVIFGLGMTSLVLDRDVIAVPGLGQVPGVVGTIFSAIGFAGGVWPWLRATRPSYGGAGVSAVLAYLGYVAGIAIGGIFSGADAAAAFSAAGGVAVSWFGLVVAAAAGAAAWGALALVRTHAERPRWPWESEDDE